MDPYPKLMWLQDFWSCKDRIKALEFTNLSLSVETPRVWFRTSMGRRRAGPPFIA